MSFSASTALKAISGDDYIDPLYSLFERVDSSIDRIRVQVKKRQLAQSERKRYIHNDETFMTSRQMVVDDPSLPVSPPVKRELPISLDSPRWKISIPSLPTFPSCPPPRACTLVTPHTTSLLMLENCTQNPPVKSISNTNFSPLNLIPSHLHNPHPPPSQKTFPSQEKVFPPTPLQSLLV